MTFEASTWLKRWDRQQEGYLPFREERFNVMFDAVEARLPASFVAVDLCCGPGSISERLLKRFPDARAIAVDLDPVLLKIGREAQSDFGGRLRWVETDINQDGWVSELGVDQVDAVLATTALHWLPPGSLVRLFRQLGKLIRQGGLFLNGDHMGFPPHLDSFRRLSQQVNEREQKESFAAEGAENWEAWWDVIAGEPGMAELVEERKRRFAWSTDDWTEPILDFYVAALRDAGFREVGTIWQRFDNRVLMAVR
jgi:SAM-dependent methyltransferase